MASLPTFTCPCSQCGPGSPKVTRGTLRNHEKADLQRQIDAATPQIPVISSASLAKRRRTANKAPDAAQAVAMDVDTQDLAQPISARSNRPLTPNHTPSDDAMAVDNADPGFRRVDASDASADPPSPPPAPDPPLYADPSATPVVPASPDDEMLVDDVHSLEFTLLLPHQSTAQPSRFWFWESVLLLGAWLHCSWHLPHRACNLMFKVLRTIFIVASLLSCKDDVPVDLRTAFRRLGLDGGIEIRAMCPRCRRTFPADSPANLLCSHCKLPLFHEPERVPDSARPRPGSSHPKPILQAPHLPLSHQLVEFLNRDDNETACEAYLTRVSVPGKLSDIQDGEIARSLKAPDGRPFFDTAVDRPNPTELRMGLGFGEDGFAFTRTKDAASHTTGVSSFCVTGLPPHLRYRPRNLLPTDLSPGPNDQTADQFQHSFELTVDELEVLYEPGIFVSTRKYPKGPAMVPQYSRMVPHMRESNSRTSQRNWEKHEKARLRRIASGKRKKGDSTPKPPPKPIRMLKDDVDIFLKLATFCKIILAGTVDLAALPRAQHLLEEYLEGFFKNHPTLVKPNFHYITHIFRTIRDFGPVYGFWTFLFERLNKLLKSYDTNNHGNGELEVTFLREFIRDARLRELLRKYATQEGPLSPEEQCIADNAQLILASDLDTRGTLAAMAAEIETLSEDGIWFSLGPSANAQLDESVQVDLLEFYASSYPDPPIVARSAFEPPPNAQFLVGHARTHNYFIRDGRRINTSKTLGRKADSSIIQIDIAGTRYVGEVLRILTHHQTGVSKPQYLLDVRWLRRDTRSDMSAWAPYPELEIFSWEYDQYLQSGDPGPPHIIPLASVISQASRLTVNIKKRVVEEDDDDDASDVEAESSDGAIRKVWFTAGLTRDVVVV
ncbi:alcohol dehydrogenase [Mycena kentingensis (nom. inval.)]|nr:alcohol dehydrogenase [Mycena kentingensis (nom. inval.)]